MAERNRLDALKEAGRSAWQGLLVAVRGVDVVVEEPPPAAPLPDGVGTVIGRRAMAAASHRIGGAMTSDDGVAVDAAALLNGVELTLAVYPSAFNVAGALGLVGMNLPEDGDLETAATACDLAWLPLETGREIFARVASGRLVAVGGYRRAAQVEVAPGGGPVWCCLGEEALAAGTPGGSAEAGGGTVALLMERPAALWRAASEGRARRVLAGGALLERLLTLPGARVARAVDAPVWGLFSATGRAPALQPLELGDVLLVPVEGE